MTTTTQDEGLSRLEGAIEILTTVATNMVTKDELRSAIEGSQASIEGLRAGTQASIERLRAETQAYIEVLDAKT